MSLFMQQEMDFEIVYNKYADMLYRLALSHMLHKEDAEDVVHDVFVKYMYGLHLPMDEAHEKAWFIRVTVNQCCDALRKKKYRMHDSLDDVQEIAKFENPELQDLMAALQKLPPKYRSIVDLHYLEGYSVEEVGKIMGLSASAVKMRLKRSRGFLKEELEEESK